MLKTIKLTSSYLTRRKFKKENKKIIKLTVARVLLKVFLLLHLLPNRLAISPIRTSFSKEYKQSSKMQIERGSAQLGECF